RVTLFIMMLMWALLKITAPQSYAGGDDGGGIFGSYYGVGVGGGVVLFVGVAQIAFLLAFLAGVAKFVTTGGVMIMNLATLLVSLPTILPAFAGGGNILFAASFPVFGASLALFLMRERDTFLSAGSKTEPVAG
ncbi:MAG: hypothetical protein AAF322_12215, partial [Pseudomonadota bacterium]